MKINACWLYAISKYGYPPFIEDTFKVIGEVADLGFEAIELEVVGFKNLEEMDFNKARILELCESLGLKIMNLCPVFRDIVSYDDSRRERAFKGFEKAAKVASFLGSEMIQIDSYTPPLNFIGETPYKEAISFGKPIKVKIDEGFDWSRFWLMIVNSVKRCDKVAWDSGLKLCMEPRVGESISNTDAMLRLIDAVRSDNFGAVLDTGHLHAQKEIIPLSIEKLGRKIFYVHASDNDGRDNYHLELGQGTIDWEDVLRALNKFSFKGYIGIDVGHVPNIEEAYKRSKGFLEELMKKLSIPP